MSRGEAGGHHCGAAAVRRVTGGGLLSLRHAGRGGGAVGGAGGRPRPGGGDGGGLHPAGCHGSAALTTTTLHGLGLLQGKGLLRLKYKQPEALRSQVGVYDMKVLENYPERPHRPMQVEAATLHSNLG